MTYAPAAPLLCVRTPMGVPLPLRAVSAHAESSDGGPKGRTRQQGHCPFTTASLQIVFGVELVEGMMAGADDMLARAVACATRAPPARHCVLRRICATQSTPGAGHDVAPQMHVLPPPAVAVPLRTGDHGPGGGLGRRAMHAVPSPLGMPDGPAHRVGGFGEGWVWPSFALLSLPAA